MSKPLYAPESIPLNKTVVLFNGPPGCGKDTMVSHLVPYLNFQHMKFAAPIKRMAAALLGVEVSTIERIKDAPHRVLRKENGEDDTVRQLLINLSEDFLKKHYGNEFFGRLAVYEAGHSMHSLLLYSDCGFEPEVQRVISSVGRSNCLLIRLRREGCDFSSDSRSYLSDELCTAIDVHNDDTVHNVTMRCLYSIKKHLNVELLKEPFQWIQ